MRRTHLNTAAFTALLSLGLVSTPGHAQTFNNAGDPLSNLTGFLHADPLLVAAFVLAMTLVIGVLLDALRGRFRRSGQAGAGHASDESEHVAPTSPVS